MTLPLTILAFGLLLFYSGIKGASIAELIKGEPGSNTKDGWNRIFGVDAFRAQLGLGDSKGGEASSGGGGNLPKGVGHFDGKPVANWIIPYLKYGRAHGWRGSVTSGWRSRAEQTAIYNSGVRPAAKPGTSNHEGENFPRGAVDVSDAAGLDRALRGYPNRKLRWAGAKDPVHFSYPHGGSY